MKSLEDKIVKTVVARLEKGEDLFVSLNQLVNQYNVRSGSIQVIGAVEKGRLGVFVHDHYKWIDHSGEMEISSCIGNVSIKEGKPFVHAHAVFSDEKGFTMGGHVAEGSIVNPTAEVYINVYSSEIERKEDKDSGLWLLDL